MIQSMDCNPCLSSLCTQGHAEAPSHLCYKLVHLFKCAQIEHKRQVGGQRNLSFSEIRAVH